MGWDPSILGGLAEDEAPHGQATKQQSRPLPPSL